MADAVPPRPTTVKASRDINSLIEILAALRTPVTGCPWDLEQTFATIAPYTIEEAYEVVDAIERGDGADLRDELGDLLLQVVFHAQIAAEQDLFDFGTVVEAITAKLIRRHPHVFGSVDAVSADDVRARWDKIKADERTERQAARAAADHAADGPGHLSGIPVALPALSRAFKLQHKASAVGFDWNDARLVLAKIREETDEIEEAVGRGSADQTAEEIGDLLFAVANLARHLAIDPESALRRTNAKFERRFRFIEAALATAGKTLASATLEEMDALWTTAKTSERQG